MLDLKKVNYQRSPNLKEKTWLEKRLVFRGYSYPVKNLLLIGIAFLLLIILSVYFLAKYRNNQNDPNVAIQRETKALTDRIGRFMELPTDEQPTLATVTDREKLTGQDFFANAQNGDKLLVYPKAQKAILFRPSTGKIIEVSKLTSGENQNAAPPQSSPSSDNSNGQ